MLRGGLAAGAPFTIFTVLLGLAGAWLFNHVFGPFEGRIRWRSDEPPTLEELHQMVRDAQGHTPDDGGDGFGPNTAAVEAFLDLLRATRAWPDEYRGNFDLNPSFRRPLARRLPSLLKMARASHRQGALARAAAAALSVLPEEEREAWASDATLAVWALVLRDCMDEHDFWLFYGPFRGLPERAGYTNRPPT